MSRFYVRPADVHKGEIIVTKEEARHIACVMRMAAGDRIVAFDGTGKEYVGRIVAVRRGHVRIAVDEERLIREEAGTRVSLAQALPKRQTMDMIVEKATELGVAEITPVVTDRTVVRLDPGGRDAKRERWQKIALSASKQCGRADIPAVRPVSTFADILGGARGYDAAMMACLAEDTRPLKEVIPDIQGKKILVMVGPEGDFSPAEIKAAAASGCILVSLGKRVLRVETAALYILSVMDYEGSV
jgi:16S rRNA (uracil1498-N3)-methyltransferase